MSDKFDEACSILRRPEVPVTLKVSADEKLAVATLMCSKSDVVFTVSESPDGNDVTITKFPVTASVYSSDLRCDITVSKDGHEVKTIGDLAASAVVLAQIVDSFMNMQRWINQFKQTFTEG